MHFASLEEWRAHCRNAAADGGDRDRALLESAWAPAGITPPPAHGDLSARVPLERAERLEREAASAPSGDRRAMLEEAVAWLDCPHPRAPAELRRAMRRARDHLSARLREIGEDDPAGGDEPVGE